MDYWWPPDARAAEGGNDGCLSAAKCSRHIGSSTEEVQLGALRALKLTTDQTVCAIFQSGELCLAVLGLPGQTLPESALERIAGELAQPKN